MFQEDEGSGNPGSPCSRTSELEASNEPHWLLRACSDARFSREKRFSEKRFHTAFRALDITLPELAVTCHSSHPLKTTASSHPTHLKTRKKDKYSSRCYCSTPTGFIAAIHAISNVHPVRYGASSCHHHTLGTLEVFL